MLTHPVTVIHFLKAVGTPIIPTLFNDTKYAGNAVSVGARLTTGRHISADRSHVYVALVERY